MSLLGNWGPALPIIKEENDVIHEALASYNNSICQQTSQTKTQISSEETQLCTTYQT